MNEKLTERLRLELEEIRQNGLYKTERIIESPQGADIEVNIPGKEGIKHVINLCANNYLRLSSHPEVIKAAKEEPADVPLSGKPIIAVLPGSRKQEVSVKLPIMLTMAKHFPEYQFIVAQAPSLDDHFLESLTGKHPNVSMVKGQTYKLLRQAQAALVTSGTATLETALFGVPEGTPPTHSETFCIQDVSPLRCQ